MLTLRNKFRPGFMPHLADRFDLKRYPFGDDVHFFGVRSLSTKVGRLVKIYDDFVGSDQVLKAHNQIIEVESKCLRSQNVRLAYQHQLITAQMKLKDLQSQLKDASTVNKSYPSLVAEELHVLKQVRALLYDFHLSEEVDLENFLQLQAALAKYCQAEQRKTERASRFLIYASALGLAFGILGTIASIYLHNYLKEDSNVHRKNVLNDLALNLAVFVDAKNHIVHSFLGDMATILGSKLLTGGELVSLDAWPSAEAAEAVVLSWFQNVVPQLIQKNDENTEEMKKLSFLLDKHFQSQDFKEMPSLEPRIAGDISGIWRTTFLYSIFVVGVPLIYALWS